MDRSESNIRNKRTSILKSQKQQMLSTTEEDEDNKANRKVRFSSNFVRAFTTTSDDNNTIWDSTYEEAIEKSSTASLQSQHSQSSSHLSALENQSTVELNGNQMLHTQESTHSKGRTISIDANSEEANMDETIFSTVVSKHTSGSVIPITSSDSKRRTMIFDSNSKDAEMEETMCISKDILQSANNLLKSSLETNRKADEFTQMLPKHNQESTNFKSPRLFIDSKRMNQIFDVNSEEVNMNETEIIHNAEFHNMSFENANIERATTSSRAIGQPVTSFASNYTRRTRHFEDVNMDFTRISTDVANDEYIAKFHESKVVTNLEQSFASQKSNEILIPDQFDDIEKVDISYTVDSPINKNSSKLLRDVSQRKTIFFKQNHDADMELTQVASNVDVCTDTKKSVSELSKTKEFEPSFDFSDAEITNTAANDDLKSFLTKRSSFTRRTILFPAQSDDGDMEITGVCSNEEAANKSPVQVVKNPLPQNHKTRGFVPYFDDSDLEVTNSAVNSDSKSSLTKSTVRDSRSNRKTIFFPAHNDEGDMDMTIVGTKKETASNKSPILVRSNPLPANRKTADFVPYFDDSDVKVTNAAVKHENKSPLTKSTAQVSSNRKTIFVPTQNNEGDEDMTKVVTKEETASNQCPVQLRGNPYVDNFDAEVTNTASNYENKISATKSIVLETTKVVSNKYPISVINTPLLENRKTGGFVPLDETKSTVSHTTQDPNEASYKSSVPVISDPLSQCRKTEGFESFLENSDIIIAKSDTIKEPRLISSKSRDHDMDCYIINQSPTQSQTIPSHNQINIFPATTETEDVVGNDFQKSESVAFGDVKEYKKTGAMPKTRKIAKPKTLPLDIVITSPNQNEKKLLFETISIDYLMDESPPVIEICDSPDETVRNAESETEVQDDTIIVLGDTYISLNDEPLDLRTTPDKLISKNKLKRLQSPYSHEKLPLKRTDRKETPARIVKKPTSVQKDFIISPEDLSETGIDFIQNISPIPPAKKSNVNLVYEKEIEIALADKELARRVIPFDLSFMTATSGDVGNARQLAQPEGDTSDLVLQSNDALDADKCLAKQRAYNCDLLLQWKNVREQYKIDTDRKTEELLREMNELLVAPTVIVESLVEKISNKASGHTTYKIKALTEETVQLFIPMGEYNVDVQFHKQTGNVINISMDFYVEKNATPYQKYVCNFLNNKMDAAMLKSSIGEVFSILSLLDYLEWQLLDLCTTIKSLFLTISLYNASLDDNQRLHFYYLSSRREVDVIINLSEINMNKVKIDTTIHSGVVTTVDKINEILLETPRNADFPYNFTTAVDTYLTSVDSR